MATQPGAAETPQPPRNPGIMLVRSRITDPTFTPSQYLTWTRLHFEDLLNIPTDPSKGALTHAFRFTSQPEDAQAFPYFNTIHLEDISLLQDQPYLAVTRRLDIENTREGAPLKFEAVGRSGMIFEVVDARFAVFGLRDSVGGGGDGGSANAYDVLTSDSRGKHPVEDGVLLAIGVTPGRDTVFMDEEKDEVFVQLKRIIMDTSVSPRLKLLVYKLEKGAQPPQHPGIDDVPEYLLLCFLTAANVVEELQKLAAEWQAVLGDGSSVTSSVWKGETGMGV